MAGVGAARDCFRTEAATLPVRPRTRASDERHPLAIALIVPSRSCIALDGSVSAAQAGRSESPTSTRPRQPHRPSEINER